MIACIIIVSLSFIWLGYETQWFTPRIISSKPLQSKSGGIKSKSNATGLTKPKLDKVEATIKRPVKKAIISKVTKPQPIQPTTNPVTFTPLDIPDIQGTVNIMSKRS